MGSDRGITHFFTATRNTTEGVGERKRTNEQYGLWSAPSARRIVLWHFFFCTAFHAFCRLSLGVYFSRNFSKATRNANSSWLVFPHCFLLLTVVDSGLLTHLDWSLLLSVLDSSLRLPSTTDLSVFLYQLPLSLLSDLPFLPTSGLVRDLESKPFVWFRAKTDQGIVC